MSFTLSSQGKWFYYVAIAYLYPHNSLLVMDELAAIHDVKWVVQPKVRHRKVVKCVHGQSQGAARDPLCLNPLLTLSHSSP